jgi:hypothetical protein
MVFLSSINILFLYPPYLNENSHILFKRKIGIAGPFDQIMHRAAEMEKVFIRSGNEPGENKGRTVCNYRSFHDVLKSILYRSIPTRSFDHVRGR